MASICSSQRQRLQLGAVEQQHAAGPLALAAALFGRQVAADHGLAAHVAVEQFEHVAADREDVGVGDQRAPLEAHQLRHHAPQRAEGLQVVVVPGGHLAHAQVALALATIQVRCLLELQDAHVEAFRMAALAAERMRRGDGSEQLLLVGVDEYDRFVHGAELATCVARDSVRRAVRRPWQGEPEALCSPPFVAGTVSHGSVRALHRACGYTQDRYHHRAERDGGAPSGTGGRRPALSGARPPGP